MAQLTPMAKGLVTVIVLGIAGSAAWNVGLKEQWQNRQGETVPPMVQPAGKTMAANGAATPDLPAKAAATGAKLDKNAAIGSSANPLRVSIVSFHGYAPALVANGKSLNTQPDSIYRSKGLNVQFVIQDDIPTLSTLF